MKKLIKLLTLVFILCLMPCATFAQSASAEYNTGVNLMKKKQWNAAIKHFEASKIIDSSSKNKSKCDQQIRKCRNSIVTPSKPDPVKSIKYEIEVTKRGASFPYSGGYETIGVKATGNEWSYRMENSADISWCNIKIGEGNTFFTIECAQNGFTIDRTAKIFLGCNKEFTQEDSVIVMQKGIPVKFDVNTDQLKRFSRKKVGEIYIPVKSNSTTIYSDGFNWHVAERPTWCTFTKVKEKDFKERFWSKFKKNATMMVGGEVQDLRGYDYLHITVERIDKNDKLYNSGRSGEFKIVSQDVTKTFTITQF